MKKLNINDMVLVITGKDKGKKGKITSIDWSSSRVTVEGLNQSKKAIKPTQENPAGGYTVVESSLHISNVQVFSDAKSKGSRVRITSLDGKNNRTLVACGAKL